MARDKRRKLSIKKPPKKFDGDSDGYDYDGAKKAGLKPDPKTGRWPSRDPKTGLLFKGSNHRTWPKTVAGEKKEGYYIYKRKGRYYSKEKPTTAPLRSSLLLKKKQKNG